MKIWSEDLHRVISVKYEGSGEKSLFYKTLKERVDGYFTANNLSKYANGLVKFKIALFLTLYFGLYFLIVSNWFSPVVMLLMAMAWGMVCIMIAMNIGHDALHNALFRNKKTNRIFGYAFELVGLSSTMWQLDHNIIHHPHPNVTPIDIEITQSMPFIRFSTQLPVKKMHRYQHLYAPFIYLLFSINIIFLRDFEEFGLIPMKYRQTVVRRFTLLKYLELFAGKILYVTFALIIPMLLINLPWWKTLLGFLAVHATMSIFELCIQLPLHINEHTKAVEMDTNGVIHRPFELQTLESTVDYLSTSPAANFFFGGINTHVIHHFFPGICHVHYPELTKILAQTAREFNLPYHEVPWLEGILSHFRQLKNIGASSEPTALAYRN